MTNKLEKVNNHLHGVIRQVLETARHSAYKAVKFAMGQAYWQIGCLIIEEEQNGESSAAYGNKTLEGLAERLTAEFGKGLAVTNLKCMCSFYQAFPIIHVLRDELSWTHYRLLLKVENQDACALKLLDVKE
jgi:hypothetical protein